MHCAAHLAYPANAPARTDQQASTAPSVAEKVIEGFMEGPKAKEGALLPKVVVESSGAKSTSLQIIGKPSSEKGDFCDYIWFSGKTGDTLFQQQFRSNGKSTKEAASADATVQARAPAPSPAAAVPPPLLS